MTAYATWLNDIDYAITNNDQLSATYNADAVAAKTEVMSYLSANPPPSIMQNPLVYPVGNNLGQAICGADVDCQQDFVNPDDFQLVGENLVSLFLNQQAQVRTATVRYLNQNLGIP
jgi:hypothetical protein